MDSVNQTLYIPLYGKTYVSRRGIILNDPKAEEIWAAEGFSLKGKAASKWLSFYMGMRAVVFDRWVKDRLEAMPEAIVLHMGCGMDSRVCRVGAADRMWYDVDFPSVIAERKRYYPENETYQMIAADVREEGCFPQTESKQAIVVMEGISMYLQREELMHLLTRMYRQFDRVAVLMDCYTEFAAKASKYKNPINEVGVTEVTGLDDPVTLEHSGLRFVREFDMTPPDLIDQLDGLEKTIFRKLYAGRIARKMYRMYEYQK